MHKIVKTFIILLSLPVFSVAQAQQGTVEMDAIAFVRDSGKIQVEIYYSIIQGALQFEQRGNTWVAPINARAEIWDNGHRITSQDIKKEKIFTGSKASLDSSRTSLILGGAALTGNIGSNPEAALIFTSKTSTGGEVYDTISRKFFVPVVEKNKFFMSGIELANSLAATSDRTNPFEKVGYIIIPNPSKVYSTANSKLNYYTELYIPAANGLPTGSVEIITKVLDGQKHEMFSNSHSQVLAAQTIPLVGSIDIDGLPTDSYILEISVKRGTTVETSVQKVFFYDSGMKLSEDQNDPSSVPDEETIFSSSDLSKMAQLELLEKGDQAMYTGKTDQIKTWKKLKTKLELDAENEHSITDNTKSNTTAQKEEDVSKLRRFLYGFWREKDKEAGSSEPLKQYKNFYKHVEDVNKKYTSQKTPGWETDFGRISLTYGEPEERNIKRVLYTIDAKPYIVWQYITNSYHLTSTERASSEPAQLSINYNYPTFVFVDRQGGKKFDLVHSNVPGEVFQPDWYIQEAKRTR